MQIPSPITKRRPRIEIIPLIDIMFFLLATFVMVSLSMSKNRGIAVSLPMAASSTPQEQKTLATVTVTEAGRIYLDQQPMDLETLSIRLQELKRKDPELRVSIHGDERAMFGQAIQVLDQVRLLGITKVAIQTRNPLPNDKVK